MRKTNLPKRILCLSLALLMLLPMLVACKGDKQDDKTGVDKDLLAAEMPDDGVGFQDFEGREIRFLGWTGASANEFEVDAEDTGTTLKAAVFARNEAIEGRLNVKLKWDYISGHAGYESSYASEAGQRASAGTIDVFSPYSRVGALLMMNGATRDMKNVEFLNLEDEWWSQAIKENCTVNDRLYFAGGDISWTLMGMTIAFCFNKDILNQRAQVLDNFGVSSMYELVDEGKWTIDNFITISKAVAAKNTYGFTSYIVPMDAFYKGCDLDWMLVNANGQQEISTDQGSGKVNTVLGKLSPFFRTEAAKVRLSYNDSSLSYAENNGNLSNPSNPEWQNGQALFVLNSIVSITDYKFTELGFDFGVLPMPKYDEKQASYKTTPDFEYSIVAIPRQVQNELLTQVGAVLQVMASEGRSRIAPAYYEEVLKKQESDSADDYTMWETIKDSIELDGGRMFDQIKGTEHEGFSWGSFRYSLQLAKNTINEQWEPKRDQATLIVQEMNSQMKKIEDNYS